MLCELCGLKRLNRRVRRGVAEYAEKSLGHRTNSHVLTLGTMMMTRAEKPPLLDFHNLRVMRGQKIALDDFSLRIEADEHVAILGPNGCGKSTLIKTITRECYPVARENSRMTILGRERWNIFELRSLLGIVSNDLLAWCKADTPGLEVVLSGFFSSQRVFRNHRVQPD